MTETTAEPRAAIPRKVWAAIRADPTRAPEHIALAASEYHAPAAEAWAAEKRSRYAHDGRKLAEMAKRTGVSLGYLSQIELGKNSASIETLYRISLGLGIKMAELFQTVQPST